MANERKDYVAAFVIGAVVGIGATMLLTPPPKKRRLVYQMEPVVKRLRKRGRRLSKTLRRGN
jgi:hypothetical protein